MSPSYLSRQGLDSSSRARKLARALKRDDQPKPGMGCGTPLDAPPSFRCSAPVNVMKQRFTSGVHIKRGGAPRYSYPYAKRDATCARQLDNGA